MKIPTRRFGTLDIEEERVIYFPSGVIGFPNHKRYILLEHKKGSPFLWLQSVDDEALAFVVSDPLLFKSDYEVRVGLEDRKGLELSESCNGLQTFVIVNITPGEPAEITANLLGPLFINPQRRLARQVVLYQYPYSTRAPIPVTPKNSTE